ncbi:MAG: hypothetical protein J6Y24_10320 [Bacteroidales bacterium]|nr:hypothetical protein [Bacteroidales bacterium]
MKNILKFLLVVLVSLPLGLQAQNTTCVDQLKMRKPMAPYRYNTASKSAMCQTGRKYEFVLPITKGMDYRIQFFASTVFNNNIDVKIIDMSTGEVVVNVPGKLQDDEPKSPQQTALQEYMDLKKNKFIHPFFDFTPVSSTSLKIMIDVKEVEVPQEQVQEYSYSDYDYESQPRQNQQPAKEEGYAVPVEKNKGCISVYIIDRETEEDTF